MEPMKPMAPMARAQAWWPQELGRPASAGSQNGMRYAFFPGPRRLLIEQDGRLATYDSGEHRISGVSQLQGEGRSLAFTSQDGPVSLDALRRL